jgi:hypothetical protein
LDFVTEQLGRKVSLQTIRNYCGANHLGWLQAKVRSTSQALTNHQQVQLAIEFIDLLETEQFYKARLGNKFCLDSTFTTVNKGAVRTVAARARCDFSTLSCCVLNHVFAFYHCLLFSMICTVLSSATMPNVAVRAPVWTNCVVTCVCDDGTNKTPAKVYTYNPSFDLKCVSKAKAR